MRQFKVSHPGEMVADLLAEMNVSARRFALNIGVTPATASRLLSGKTALTPALAIRISAALGSTPEFWMRLQNKYDLHQLEDQIDTTNIKRMGVEDADSAVSQH